MNAFCILPKNRTLDDTLHDHVSSINNKITELCSYTGGVTVSMVYVNSAYGI